MTESPSAAETSQCCRTKRFKTVAYQSAGEQKAIVTCFSTVFLLQQRIVMTPPIKNASSLGRSSGGSLMLGLVYVTLLTPSIWPLLSALDNNEVALLSGLI